MHLDSIQATYKLVDSTPDVHLIYIDGFNVKIKVNFKENISVLKSLVGEGVSWNIDFCR